MKCYCSIAQSYPTLCDPMDCCTPGFPVLHYLQELAQTHVHWASDAIQPSHPLSSPSPPALNLPQHQGLSNELALHIRWPKYWTSASASVLPMNIQGENKYTEVKMSLYMCMCICIIYNPSPHLKYGISLVHESAWLFWAAPLCFLHPCDILRAGAGDIWRLTCSLVCIWAVKAPGGAGPGGALWASLSAWPLQMASPVWWLQGSQWRCSFHSFLKKKNCLYFWLFMYVLGPCCCPGFSLVATNEDSSRVAVHGLLTAVASLVGSTGCRCMGFNSCTTWAQQLWHLGLGLSASEACGVFLDQGSNPHPLHWQADFFNHWATRETLVFTS